MRKAIETEKERERERKRGREREREIAGEQEDKRKISLHERAFT